MSTFYDWVFHHEVNLHKHVLSTFERDYSLGDLKEEAGKYQSFLLEHLGNIRGKRVGILIPSAFVYISVFLAVNKLGGTVIPLSHQFRKDDLTSVLRLLDPHIVFTVTEHGGFDFGQVIGEWAKESGKETIVFTSANFQEWNKEKYSGSVRPPEGEHMDVISCSSGSTGTPKGIITNMNAWVHWLDRITEKSALKATDNVFLIVPSGVPYGISWIFSVLRKGARMVLPDTFDLLRSVQYLEKNECNKIVSTPSVFQSFYKFAQQIAPSILEKFEMAIFAGEMISRDFIQSLTPSMGQCRFVGFYGLSEQGMLMYCDDLTRLEWKIAPNVDWTLKTEELERDIGELVFRSPAAFAGYYRRPDLTEEVFTKDGWFFTGDLGRVKENRTIELVGRKKDIIKKGGQQIVPAEIEQVLLQNPRVKQAVVIGAPHPVFGEKIVAFIVGDEELQADELYAFLTNRIAPYKIPDEMRKIDKIPINQGKIDKLTLRKLIEKKGVDND
ncbi:AMP-binding protein [Bacillaceae bacterium]